MLKHKYVDTIIGTVGDEQQTSLHGGGKTYPGACLPGGMVQLSPDTVTGGDNGTGYNYCNSTIEGFSFNHMSGIGWYGDLGNLQIMPVCGKTDLRSGTNYEVSFKKGTLGWRSEFSHENEVTQAGYYSVKLERYGIFAEATVTMRAGMLRFTYPAGKAAKLIMNFSRRIGGHADFQHVDIVNDRCIEGYIKCTPAGGGFGRGKGNIAYTMHFVCEFSAPFSGHRFFSNEEYADADIQSFEGDDTGLELDFGNTEQIIVLKCGISYVDIEGARNNLMSECPGFDFETVKSNAQKQWEDALSAIEVEGSDETDLKLFYTCLYHTLLDPRVLADADGRYCIKGEVFADEKYTQRTMFSGWDVYRSEMPLLAIIDPDLVNDEVNSLIKAAQLGNSSFPRWELMGIDSGCMVGDPGLIVTADAYIKGIRGFDAERAYKIALASCNSSKELDGKPFRSLHPDSDNYRTNAFVENSISETLEFLLADYTMWKFAEAMGRKTDAEYFASRTKKYAENYDSKTGFLLPRDKDGKFVSIKNEYDTFGCVESNILQQTWFVPYAVRELCELMGMERVKEMLERFFESADFSSLWNEDYNHSNEPCHNITHYFNLLGLAHRTQYWTRRVQKEAYRTGAFGFCGNEDVGQLSAWYVLSAIGFAQICPCDEKYYINTPLFKRASVKLDKKYHSCSVSNVFEVECDNDPSEYPYISSINLNGTEISRHYLYYSEITAGGRLTFNLSKTPCIN